MQGPNRIAKLRKEATAMGLDPNVWFGNVEVIAAKDIGQETVTYVSNVSKFTTSRTSWRLNSGSSGIRRKRRSKVKTGYRRIARHLSQATVPPLDSERDSDNKEE